MYTAADEGDKSEAAIPDLCELIETQSVDPTALKLLYVGILSSTIKYDTDKS